jgi:Icc-related predicted phosphoesterase
VITKWECLGLIFIEVAMRLVVTSDTHREFPVSFIPAGDVFIHCGDLMMSGYLSEWSSRLDSLAALPHKIKLLIPGNHDKHIELYTGPSLQDLRGAGVTVIGLDHNQKYMSFQLPNGMSVLGLPWVTNLPNWAFSRSEEWITEYLAYQAGRHQIVCSHSPPAGVLDNGFGVRAYRSYLEQAQPDYWFCGHVHEGYGSEVVAGCQVYNVSAQDRRYSGLVNKPVVIDL